MAGAAPTLSWLPPDPDWRAKLKVLMTSAEPEIEAAVALAGKRIDFVQTNALDSVVRSRFPAGADLRGKPVRLAMLSSCTTTHLLPAIRIGGLRRRLWVETWEADFGQYWVALEDPGLRAFEPSVLVFALDAWHVTAGIDAAMSAPEADAQIEETVQRILALWRLARETFRCQILQQAPLPAIPPLLGGNEQVLPGSRRRALQVIASRLREAAHASGVNWLAIDERAAEDGLTVWHDPALWLRSKQETSPAAAPLYGDLTARLFAAQQGLSAKCLVLDLDNTLWGGVIGDDGLGGIVLGQGSPLGEGYAALQAYAKQLSRRGILLAICSKNERANAEEPFTAHPEMALKLDDIAAFVANWDNKPSNLRVIAEQLNIGLDSFVFLDDNPAERDLVRRELPMVATPEVSDDPVEMLQTLARAGYFEALAVTEEDRDRSAQYQSQKARETLRSAARDLGEYLKSLDMRLVSRRFDEVGLQRITQLINKTNQFNLTTRRYTEEEVRAVIADADALGLQLRLIDRFGDNGIIAVLIGRLQGRDMLIDTWLMSCRVLGRQVEPATLNLLASHARELGAERLIGEYRPSAKNGMVRDHYTKLGFDELEPHRDGSRRHVLDLARFRPSDTFIVASEG